VLAIIRGTAINNDGSQKVGYLAPSVDGQARAVSEALAIADVPADTIGLIEAHGTGTAVGDPIEFEALTQVFAPLTSRKGFIALGTVKANIGHLGEASGMAGFIKTVLALQHGQLPPSINFTAPNAQIDFASSPFFVNTTLAPWVRGAAPRRAGVTALGAGGTNAHVILEEAPRCAPSEPPRRRAQLLTISAKSPTALEHAARQLADFLEHDPSVTLADAAWTLHEGRTAFPYRRSVVARDAARAVVALRAPHRGMLRAATGDADRVIYMFPGGGAQYASMGRELYETELVYRQAFDDCLSEIPRTLAETLRRLVLSSLGTVASATTELEAPRFALPALFATEYATAKLLTAWGLEPAGMIGHSMGEYVAACLAGVFTLRDALILVIERARLFETLPAGGMLSVEMAESELLPLLGADLSIAAVNGPSLCVASGPLAAIDALQSSLTRREIEHTRVHIAVAAHSSMLEPILADFLRVCERVRYAPPRVPFISNLTGAWITPAEATDPQYWVRHLRQTVRFGDGLHALHASGQTVLLEVGPGRTLCSLARAAQLGAVAVPTLRHPNEVASDVEFLLGAIGKVWESGGAVRLSALHAGTRRRRVPLPTYPFEPHRFWLDAGVQDMASPDVGGGMIRHENLRDWFAMPAWRRSALSGITSVMSADRWLLFADRGGVADAIAAMRPAGSTVVVAMGERYARRSVTRYVVRPDAGADFAALFEALALDNRWPEQIAHMWGLDAPATTLLDRVRKPDASRLLDRAVGDLYVSLLCIVQAAAAQEKPLVLSAVASGLFSCSDSDEPPDPMKSLLLGPTQVAPREFPYLRSRCIDVALSNATVADIASRVLQELQRPVADSAVALRPHVRWVRVLDAVPLDPAPLDSRLVRERATVLITGGLGGIGLAIAAHLAKTAQAKLVLIGRTAVPDRRQWETLARDATGGRTAHQAAALLAIEASGGEVLALQADVTDLDQMTGVVALAVERFGAIHGVIHSAGLIDDGLISLKSSAAPTPVITVKALGALVLDEVLRFAPLDFFIACSSISSVMGLEGQVDYTAANAFLDAYLERKCRTGSVRALSIGWNAWRDLGMTATLADGTVRPAARPDGSAGPHPDLEQVTIESDGTRVYTTLFSRARQWLLSEHVVRGGDALIPGTGYLELARASLDEVPVGHIVELRKVMFLSPFVVGRSAPRRLRLRLAGTSDGTSQLREFTFIPEGDREPCVVGLIGHRPAKTDSGDSLAVIRARIGAPMPRRSVLHQPFMDFGPRWANVVDVAVNGTEALVRLRLPEEFHADLATYPLHPALMDMATGGAQSLIPGFDQASQFYVPIGYDRIQVHAGLTAALCSHVRYDANGSSSDVPRFDIDIYAVDGALLVSLRGFTMKRLGADAALRRAPTEESSPTSTSLSNLRGLLRLGIAPAEGLDALDRMLASGLSGHIISSSINVPQWLAYLERRREESLSQLEDTSDAMKFARPEIATTFVAPRTATERDLCEMWKQLLGVREVGIHDDFFELGGQSLVAVRLFSRIRKHFRVDLPLSTLFEAPTIAQCAAVIAQEAGVDSEALVADASPDAHFTTVSATRSAVRESNARAARSSRWRSLVVMQHKGSQAPFVCVAGMGGTLNNLRNLAMLLGASRPVYGLQPPGADNAAQLLDSVEQLASHYIDELRREQPNGPYFLGGYSGGGVAAFEMAKQLLAAGEKVAFLAFIDSFSPALPQRSWGERARLHARRAGALGPRYFFDMVQRRLNAERGNLRLKMARRLGRVMPDEFRYDAIGASWIAAEEKYRPAPQTLRATLFRAREESALSLWSGVKVDGEHGWGRYVLDGVEVQLCPGNHTTMCEEPNVRVLATRLRAAIDTAAATISGTLSKSPGAHVTS
jgi:acyl transferase domain-containing protein/thioesterase domain-containing protein